MYAMAKCCGAPRGKTSIPTLSKLKEMLSLSICLQNSKMLLVSVYHSIDNHLINPYNYRESRGFAYERAHVHMLGKSHLLIGLTAGVVFDSVTHVSGHPLTGEARVDVPLLMSKA